MRLITNAMVLLAALSVAEPKSGTIESVQDNSPDHRNLSLLRFAVRCGSLEWLVADSEPKSNGGYGSSRLVVVIADDSLNLRNNAVVREVLTAAASFAQAKCVEPRGYSVIRVKVRRGAPSSFTTNRFPPRPHQDGLLTLDHIGPWIEEAYPSLAMEAFNATNMEIVFPPVVADVRDIRWVEYRNFEEEEENRRQEWIRAEYERSQQLARAELQREAEAAEFRQVLSWGFLIGCGVVALVAALSVRWKHARTDSVSEAGHFSHSPSSGASSSASFDYGDSGSDSDYSSNYDDVQEVSRSERESSQPSDPGEAETTGWNWATRDVFGNDGYHPGQQHNQGQTDASEGRYNPPIRDPLGVLIDSFTDGHKEYEAAKEAYDKGHAHGSSQKGCFLSTACVHARGLPDDCEILTKARVFRDTYVAALPNGENIIRRYYELAPRIVRAVNAAGDSQAEWVRVYDEILEVIRRIDNRDLPGAFDAYRVMCGRLEHDYVEPPAIG